MSNRSRRASRSPDKSVIKIRTEKNGFGKLKVGAIALLVLLQLCFFIYLYLIFAWISGVFMLIAFILSVISCIFLLSSNRSPASKAVWIFIILIFFQVGYFLYFLSSDKYFFRKSRKRYKKIFSYSDERFGAYSVCEPSDCRVKEDIEFLKKSGGFTAFSQTDAKYFSSGGLFFDDVLEKISKAEKFVFIEFFIISEGVLLERFLHILTEKVKSGVDVRIIYDDLGCHGAFPRRVRKRIKNCGIKLMTFNRLIPAVNLMLNIRDHRKLIIIDGKTAYTGGANLADEYTNEARLYGYWKDGGVRVEGPAVDGFTLMFLRQHDYLTRKLSDYEKYFNHFDKKRNASVAVPFSCGLDRDGFIGKELYFNVFSRAQKRLYLMTPYLVPDEALLSMLISKALSGVDVRIILPEIPDKPYVYRITRNNAAKLEESGVKIYLMRDSFVHSKFVLSDYCAIIGSINLDMRSFYQQFESALYTDDKELMAEVEADFERTFEECRPQGDEKNTLVNKVIACVLKIVSPLM